MIEISISSADLTDIRKNLLSDSVEHCAVILASRFKREDGLVRLLAREIIYPKDEDYAAKTATNAELNPAFVARVSKKAKIENEALIFVHSHPGSGCAHFSQIDDAGEQLLKKFLNVRAPGEHGAIVLAENGISARQLGANELSTLVALGSRREVLCEPKGPAITPEEQYDRQIRVFGSGAQSKLTNIRVAIVGVGGTGSIVFQQLVHLGVKNILVFDPDIVEVSNLNRVANASLASIGQPKVAVAKEYAQRVAPTCWVQTIQGDITRDTFAKQLLVADFIFGCTDSHGSRAILQQVSYQYLIPMIDMGVTIATEDSAVKHIIGRVQLLSPEHGCFTCSSLLDPNEVRKDLMSDYERKHDPYITGIIEPAPAVISINSTVASLAVTMFLSCVTDIPAAGRSILYDARNSILRKIEFGRVINCFVCSKQGGYARGSAWPLATRLADNDD